MYAAYGGASFILLLFSGATGAVFWIIGKLTVSSGLRCIKAIEFLLTLAY